MRQGAQGWCTGMTLRDGRWREVGGGFLLISWLQSPSAVILEPKEIQSDTVSTVSPSISHEVMGTRCHDLHFLNVEL